jgi:ABC-type sugar transport system substrate-binding protein
MNQKLRRLTLSAVAAAVLAVPFAAQISVRADEPLKIGFLVKMPEQAWFINEQKAATAARSEGWLLGSEHRHAGRRKGAGCDR